MKRSVQTILLQKRGSVMIWVPVLILFILTMCTVFWEYSRLNIIAQGTRDAAQAAITQMCTDNYNRLYNGVREGYSGGYTLEDASWTDDVDASSILSKIDSKLGTRSGEKTSDGTMEYRISDLDVKIQNAPLAPIGTDVSQQFLGTATYTLTIPMSFGKQLLPPMVIHMEASGGYSQKGALTGTGGGGGSTDPIKGATGVSLSESDLTLEKGTIETLAAAVSPEDATDSLSWVATNPDVCSVNQTGTITARAAGQSTIIAAAQSGNAIAQCNVTVVTAVTGILLNKSDLTLAKGQSETLTATISPADATNKKGMWTSSDASVCTVDGNGKVTAVNAGEAVITATTQDGNFSDQCTVTVVIPTSGITLNKTNLTLIRETSETLKATVWPNNATKATVLWACSDKSICAVDQSGRIVAIKAGSAVVSATTFDGQHTAACTVTVKPKTYRVYANTANGYVVGTGVYNEGSTVTLTAVPNPHFHFVNWTDSNGNVISWNTTYTIRDLNSDTTVNANFTIDMFTVTANAGTGGYATGGGYYAYGTVISLTATPSGEYEFVKWSDGNFNSLRYITVTDNMSFTATFRELAIAWTFSSFMDGAAPWSKYKVTNTNSVDHSGVINVHANSGTTYLHGVYTFTEPFTLKAGSMIYVENVMDTKYHVNPTSVYINGINYGYTDYSNCGRGVYRLKINIPSDLVVNAIELRYEASVSNSFTTTLADIVISPADRKPFLLNNTGTSANQDGSRWYYVDGYSATINSNSITLNDSHHYWLGACDKTYLNFMKPVAIDHISYTVAGLAWGDLIDYNFDAADSYGNHLAYMSYRAARVLTMEDCHEYIQAFPFQKSTGDCIWNYYVDGRVDSGTEDYTNVSGYIDSDKVTTVTINWGCLDGPNRMTATIYFKDGTSMVIGANTAHFSYNYVGIN